VSGGRPERRAQEKPAPAPAQADELDNEPEAPRHHIQVLQNPYDISSFYRSSQGSGQDDFAYAPSAASEKYPIAGFYRAGRPGPLLDVLDERLRRNGYGTGQVRGRGLIGARRSHALGLTATCACSRRRSWRPSGR
jgi:hypothetical protein